MTRKKGMKKCEINQKPIYVRKSNEENRQSKQ